MKSISHFGIIIRWLGPILAPMANSGLIGIHLGVSRGYLGSSGRFEIYSNETTTVYTHMMLSKTNVLVLECFTNSNGCI